MTLDDLLAPLPLPCGTVLPDRLVMAPMVAQGSDPATGHVTDEDVAYFARRSRVAGTILTGAAYVNRAGRGFVRGLSIADDAAVDGLARLAAAMTRDGARALVQLFHGGRQAYPAYDELGRVLAPSTQEFDWQPFVAQAMTDDEIRATIADFGRATRRAIDAGFDGVEIHGANHYLLQQFFSAFSNHRDDAWGGDLQRRMAFPLAVVDEVRRVVAASGREGFVVGYRLCPDEVHGDVVGYPVEEGLQLVDALAAAGVDYVHVSLFTGYATCPPGAERSYGQLALDAAAGRCPVVIVSEVATACDAVRALAHGDAVAIGRAALVEPEFAAKIAAGEADLIETSIKGRLDELDLPAGLVEWYATTGRDLPPLAGMDEYQR